MTTEKLHQGEFRVFIATPANPGHDLGAFGLGEDVGHESSGREVVGHQPRRRAHHFIALFADARLRGLVAVKLVVGKFAIFKAAPRLNCERFEMFRPAAAARGETIGMQAGIQERERAPAANKLLLGEYGESLFESKTQVLFSRPARRRDVDRTFHDFQATKSQAFDQDEFIQKYQQLFRRFGEPAMVGPRCLPDDTAVCEDLQKSSCLEMFADALPPAL